MHKRVKLITIQEAADILGISKKTLYNWASNGGNHLEFVKLGGSLRVVESSVYDLIERSRLDTPSSLV